MPNLLDQWAAKFRSNPRDNAAAVATTINPNLSHERSSMGANTMRAGLQALVSMRADSPSRNRRGPRNRG
jgi:hypothetical protein